MLFLIPDILHLMWHITLWWISQCNHQWSSRLYFCPYIIHMKHDIAPKCYNVYYYPWNNSSALRDTRLHELIFVAPNVKKSHCADFAQLAKCKMIHTCNLKEADCTRLHWSIFEILKCIMYQENLSEIIEIWIQYVMLC